MTEPMESKDLNTSTPIVHFLSNGHLTSMVTDAGTGYVGCDGTALTRWSGDGVEDNEGYFIYLRDLETLEFWSIGLKPSGKSADHFGYENGFFWLEHEERGLMVRMEVSVCADKNLEIRRIILRDFHSRTRRIELTSYMEVVLNHPAADAAHPVFSKLFVSTDCVNGTLLAKRRPRSAGETSFYMFHAALGGADAQYETDRSRFLGRGASLQAPHAMTSNAPLSAHVGNVLDPVFSLRRTLDLPVDGEVELTFLLGAAASQDEALDWVSSFENHQAIDQAFEQTKLTEADLLKNLGLNFNQADYFQRLAGAMIYANPSLRADPAILARATVSRSILDKHGIPAWIYLCIVQDLDPAPIIIARRYWQTKGLNVALLILSDQNPTGFENEPVFVRNPKEIPKEDLEAILSFAHLVISNSLPALSKPRTHCWDELLNPTPDSKQPAFCKKQTAQQDFGTDPNDLEFFNGFGGFSKNGLEYIIKLDKRPPMPWINAIGNENFGFLVSESGAGYTWSRNSREYRLTPWSNDPILDPYSEALYIRDESTQHFWSPMPGPVPNHQNYQAAHGFGYTRFDHQSHGLKHETLMFVPRHDPVKIVRLKLTNCEDSPKKLSLFCYQRLVLGCVPSDSARFIVTEYDPDSKAILANNRMAGDFAGGVTFSTALSSKTFEIHHSADRASFIGRNGTLSNPAALYDAKLNHRTGAGLDACAALQLIVEIKPSETLEVSFLLGETLGKEASTQLIARFAKPDAVEEAFKEIQSFWQDTLGAIRVETPEPCIDLMLNGWLTYQNLSCRIWGRSAFYQSGGAYGFRDQLQDSAAMIYACPDLTRRQILLHAEHQFIEGDVLHWWHQAPLERGLRTRFSDDLLWLPFISAFYIKTTGDWDLLNEIRPYLKAPLLRDGEDECYLKPEDSGLSGDIYQHCCKALDKSLTQGSHGLPLMGTGDWNDGMSRVGRLGKGESIWMGFFLYKIITDFLPICEHRQDQERIEKYLAYQAHLYQALNDAGWDGEWYRRAFYDDGAVMGSIQSDECKIDALAQAWSVISNAAPLERSLKAMHSLEQHLVSDDIIRLLTPPFVDTPHDPGYIKGYVKGVRENGGQYTHAACWAVRAAAELGQGDLAVKWLKMLNPISHSMNAEAVGVYQVEPYVVAADIYGEPPHVGRGGWSWYTGSAGWMYRVGLESVLGFNLVDRHIVLKPRIANDWPGYKIIYQLTDGKTRFLIDVLNPNRQASKVRSANLDGQSLSIDDGSVCIPLRFDGKDHRVELILGE